ncbi:MAG: sigma-70 family RNA polymerase sigma factor [Rhizobiales bacterium]|nr:sigma-70 family RNA polymerase sigma factor [Hyphomicrobiales bacterium]
MEAEIPRLRRYARFLVGNADRADDLVQDCLTRAITKIDSWQPGTNMRAWLFVIMRNGYFNELRRKSRSPIIEDSEAMPAVTPGNQEAHLALQEVRRAFLQLSEEHREVLLLVAIEGLAYDEAAGIIGVPIGTVRSRASRARAALRQAVDGDQGAGRTQADRAHG